MNANAYLGLGANLGDPPTSFKFALSLIGRSSELIAVSKLYRSEPFGYSDQPPFTNAVARISTKLDPAALLSMLKTVEKALGKEIVRRNGPRVIDLDLLLYDDQAIESPTLTLPHPGILTRDFVLRPLLEISPEISHPSWGAKKAKSALSGLRERYALEDPADWDPS